MNTVTCLLAALAVSQSGIRAPEPNVMRTEANSAVVKNIALETDFVVCGGGLSGICAAISAARHGAKVVLVQDRPMLGGNASSEMRMGVMGAAGDENKEAGILEELQLMNFYYNPLRRYTLWDDVLYSAVIMEKKITLLLNTSVDGVEMENGRIASVKAWNANAYTRYAIRGKLFADCTGDGILRLSGAKFRHGREDPEEFGETFQQGGNDGRTMGNSILLQLRKTAEDHPFHAPAWAYAFTDEDFVNDVQPKEKGRHYSYKRLYPDNNNFWWIEFGGDFDTIGDANEIQLELKKIAYGVWAYMKNHPDGRCKGYDLDWIGALPGKRESVRFVGPRILTQHDVMSGGHFEDVVAYGGWTLDDHHPSAFWHHGYQSQHHRCPSPFGIPFDCLYSVNVPNLMFAGRDISVTHMALSATRVMATCATLGQAVGTAAAIAVRDGLDPAGVRKTRLAELQAMLEDDDCMLPFRWRKVSALTAAAQTDSDNEPLRNGIDRTTKKADNGVWVEPGAETMVYEWASPQKLSGVRLVFDSVLKGTTKRMMKLEAEHTRVKMPAPLAKAFRIDVRQGGKWRTVFVDELNLLRLRKVSFPTLEADALRLVVTETWGGGKAHVFAFDALPAEGPDGACAGAVRGLQADEMSSAQKDFLVQTVREHVAAAAPHPRLFASAADFARLKVELPKSELGRLGLERLFFEADQMWRFPLPMRELEGRRMLTVSQRALSRICTLAMAYRLRGDPRDAARALAEAEAVCSFKDWNPKHFLDTAEMTLAVAIAYDWLYDVATKDQRETLKNGLMRLGLCEKNGALKDGGWVGASNNWGQVCHACLLAGAIAVMEDEPAVAEKVILRALANLPKSMAAFAPAGGFPEGPGFYWGYAMTFNVLALDLLERTCGTDFGLAQQPGFAASVDYLDLMTGPSGLKFNYADAGILPNQRLLAKRTTEACSWWLANRFKRPDSLVQFEIEAFKARCQDRTTLNPTPRRVPDRLSPLTLLWLNPPPASVEQTTAPLCKILEGTVPVAVQRTDWTPEAWYVGLKGGSALAPHGHMDGGSFVLDAKGCRWAEDLGSEDYHRMEDSGRNVWDRKQKAERWKIFRLGLASHNTLRIGREDQLVLGSARITSLTTGPLSKAVLDLTSLYAGTERVERTGSLVPGGGYIMNDAVVGVKPGTVVTWQMITYARVKELAENRLVLVQKGPDGDDVTLTLTISDRRAVWEVRDVGSPQGPDESSNPGLTQISFAIQASGAGEASFAVRFE